MWIKIKKKKKFFLLAGEISNLPGLAYPEQIEALTCYLSQTYLHTYIMMCLIVSGGGLAGKGSRTSFYIYMYCTQWTDRQVEKMHQSGKCWKRRAAGRWHTWINFEEGEELKAGLAKSFYMEDCKKDRSKDQRVLGLNKDFGGYLFAINFLKERR